VWRAPCNGAIHITGQVKKGDTTGGNGVNVRVKKNKSTIWPASGGWQFIAGTDGTGYPVDVYTSVSAGDRIFFTVNAAGGTISYDQTSWDPRVDYAPLQASYTASTGFSSTQGLYQWAYQYFNGSTYGDMTWDAGSNCWIRSGTFTKICKNLQHPDMNSNSVREWIAPQAGWATVTGIVKKGDASGGDGVSVAIRNGAGTLLWGIYNIAYNNAAGLNPTVLTYPVAAGDKLLFIVDANSNISYDTTIWDPTVTLNY
jgi:hypothetical protein